MRRGQEAITVTMVPLDQIAVLNPRVRNQRVFREIVDSISKVGLKRPITVARRRGVNGCRPYELVCGQGRLEAFKSLGESDIPTIVVKANKEDSLIMSLVENLARRQHRPLELLHDIGGLGKRGYSAKEIARKTGLTIEYVRAIRRLIDEGEERLLIAVETGQIPMSVALEIAEADDEDVQEALADAYQKGLLRGRKLMAAKRLVEQRRRRGKAVKRGSSERGHRTLSSEALVRAYEKEADRQRLLIKRADVTQSRLLFVVEAMRALLGDENFVTLLRAEGLTTMPRPLAELIAKREAH